MLYRSSMNYDDDQSEGSDYERNFRRSSRALFADVDDMKARLRDQLSKPEYNVAMYYHDEGIAQKIARSHFFEQITLAVITANALWIAFDTDLNPSDVLAKAPIGFQVVEQLFCFYFVLEWLTRFLAFKKKLNGLRDAWFVFDTMLTMLFVADSWVMFLYMIITGSDGGKGLGNASILRVARLLRLTRMARMAHILRAVPELGILVKGMGAGLRSVAFTLILLLALVYIFAVAFRISCGGEHPFCAEFFSSVPVSMHTLLIVGTLLDEVGSFVLLLQDYNAALAGLFYLFVLLAALTIMNMLIGVLCEVVNTTAAVEKESMVLMYVKNRLQKIMIRAGYENVFTADSKINKQEFLDILGNRAAADVLAEVGVDVIGLVDFPDFIFKEDLMECEEEEDKLLSFADFVEVVLKLRGNNTATVRDVVDLRKFVQFKTANLEAKLDAALGRGTLKRSLTAKWAPAMSKSKSLSSLSQASTGSHHLGSMSATCSIDSKRFSGRDQSTGDQEVATKTVEVIPAATDVMTSQTSPASQTGPSSPTSRVSWSTSPTTPNFGQKFKFQPSSVSHVKDEASGNDFKRLVESLVVEHERALANMQRANCKLQAELDILKASGNSFAAAEESEASCSISQIGPAAGSSIERCAWPSMPYENHGHNSVADPTKSPGDPMPWEGSEKSTSTINTAGGDSNNILEVNDRNELLHDRVVSRHISANTHSQTFFKPPLLADPENQITIQGVHPTRPIINVDPHRDNEARHLQL